MASQNFRVYLVGLMVGTALISGCQINPGADSSKRLGTVEIREEQAKSPWPAELPRTIYVSDFALEAEHFEGDKGVRGGVPGGRSGMIGQRLPHPLTGSNPEAQAREIIEAMGQNLVKSLRDKGFIAQRLTGSQAAVPRDGWLMQGVFTEVDEGSRIKRAVIGFGRGATRMEVQVAISNLAGLKPKTPFIVLGTVKTPKKMPGAAVTMNPYVAAAKFVMEKNATEKDIKKTAEQIVEEILKHTHQFKEQIQSKPLKGAP